MAEYKFNYIFLGATQVQNAKLLTHLSGLKNWKLFSDIKCFYYFFYIDYVQKYKSLPNGFFKIPTFKLIVTNMLYFLTYKLLYWLAD